MVEQHLEETKEQLTKLANEILLNKDDLEQDNRMFASLRQKAENVIISDHLKDLANKRLENLEVFTNDKEVIEKYKEDVIDFMRKLLRKVL